MKVKVSEATGPVLNLMVAKAEGRAIHDGDWYGPFDAQATLKVSRMRTGNLDALCFLSGGVYQPSANWSQGGPIIEREKIDVEHDTANGDGWVSTIHMRDEYAYQCGPTPLIAAMRCFVASRLGDEVDVPEELLS